jgi:chemotaxis protein methyltransferase CheR
LIDVELSAAQKRLEEALADEYGWAANAANREIIAIAVASKAQRLGVPPEEYYQFAAASQSELLALVEETSIGETWFLREPEQFACLRERILPALRQTKPAERSLRLWSAACSTGEEAYSLAIVANQVEPNQPVEVFATEVRNRALLEASRARYPASALRAVDEATRAQYFSPVGEAESQQYAVAAEARRPVTFRRANLCERIFWRGMGNRFDLIVCANLLAVLHGQAARQLVTNLSNALRAGGYLMVAPAEAALIHSQHFQALAEQPSFLQKV